MNRFWAFIVLLSAASLTLLAEAAAAIASFNPSPSVRS